MSSGFRHCSFQCHGYVLHHKEIGEVIITISAPTSTTNPRTGIQQSYSPLPGKLCSLQFRLHVPFIPLDSSTCNFQIREHKLLTDFQSLYTLERVSKLRQAISSFVINTTWKPAAPFSASQRTLHIQKTLKACEYPYNNHDLEQLGRVLAQFLCATTREAALTAFLAWFIITNISLHASLKFTLLPPALLSVAAVINGNYVDEFGLWGWEKVRVYMCYMFCQTPILPLSVLLDDMEQEQPHPGAEDELVSLLRRLLEPFLDMEQVEVIELSRRCLNIAARVGLGIHRDLRPWSWSFVDMGAKEQRLSERVSSVRKQKASLSIRDSGNPESFITDQGA